ncbi:MAG: hypothetical protein IPN76_17820 [Saprospiraceae bacterium]|nr:hypothetical protein [Saprospiraceae bacterium]
MKHYLIRQDWNYPTIKKIIFPKNLSRTSFFKGEAFGEPLPKIQVVIPPKSPN